MKGKHIFESIICYNSEEEKIELIRLCNNIIARYGNTINITEEKNKKEVVIQYKSYFTNPKKEIEILKRRKSNEKVSKRN